MKTVDVRWLAIQGKAPNEADVDLMVKAMDSYAEQRGYSEECNFRQYWVPWHNHDDMGFVMMKDYKNG